MPLLKKIKYKKIKILYFRDNLLFLQKFVIATYILYIF